MSGYTSGSGFLCRSCFSYGYVSDATGVKNCLDCGKDNIVLHPELLDLHIAHIDCDAFYCSVEKRDNPALKDKPVIVGGGDRGVVAAACYVARQYGIRSAMPSWQAHKACPELVVLKPRMAHYQNVSKTIKQMMLALTPLVQSLSIDEAFLDLSGTEKLHGKPAAVVLAEFQAEIYKTVGITVSIGLGANKSLAKIASDQDKPHGFFVLGASDAKDWLAAQPVSIIFGLGKVSTAHLQARGITTCKDIQNIDLQHLRAILGNDAERIYDLAHGIDPREVIPHQKAKSVSSETTFSANERDLDKLLVIAEQQSQRVSKSLKDKNLTGRTVTLKLKTASHKIKTRSVTLPQPTQMAFRIFETVKSILEKEIDGQISYRLLGVGVGVTDLPVEAELFQDTDDTIQKQEKLERALDQLHSKLGDVKVTSGRQLKTFKDRDIKS